MWGNCFKGAEGRIFYKLKLKQELKQKPTRCKFLLPTWNNHTKKKLLVLFDKVFIKIKHTYTYICFII